MFFKRISLLLALATAAALAVAAVSAAAPGTASLVIRHQTRGCHSWSLNGGPLKAKQSIALRHGGTLTVTDNDVMSHTLVRTSGPSLRIAHPMLGHMGASTKITFTKPGVYRFTTKAGEDYMAGVKTTGEDNVLRLTVVVS
jgi:plastocyanin